MSSCRPSFFANAMFTGILAAEERVKKAGTPLSRRQVNTSGKGLRRVCYHTIIGLSTNAINSIQPSNTANSCI